jgi:hypothetical protein
MKAKPIAIPVIQVTFSYIDSSIVLTKGVVTGAHSTNKNLLIKWRGNTTAEQFHSYRATLIKADTDIAKLTALHKAKLKAETEYEDFIQANEFDRAVLQEEE